jgi:tripartite-type tricarboxylate transporter receptor subunit TctC
MLCSAVLCSGGSRMKRRQFLTLTGAAAASALWPRGVRAQTYPDRLIKFIHGFPPGGNVDVLARIVSEEMSKSLGQPIVIEAKPGVVGSLAAETVARAAPDGYTLLFLPSAHAVTASIYKSIKYDAVDDFSWISTVSFYPFVLFVRRESKFRSLGELLAQARDKPDTLSYGSTGAGSIHHMTIELLSLGSKTKFVNVPYRGENQVVLGVITGELDFAVATVTVAMPHIESGELRPLGVTGKTRWRDLPDVPTFEQAGVPDFEVISWSGLAAPPRTPRPIIDRLHDELARAVQAPGVKERIEKIGGEVRPTTPEEMRALVARQVALWARVAREAKVQVQ